MKYRCKLTIPGCREGYHVGETLQIGDIVFDVAHYPQIFEPTEEEKPKRIGIAIVLYGETSYEIKLAHSIEQIEKNLNIDRSITKIIFPARFGADGFLVIPGEE